MTNKYSATTKLHEINERVYWLRRLLREHQNDIDNGWVAGRALAQHRVAMRCWQKELDALTPIRDHMTRCERAFVDGTDDDTIRALHKAFYDAYNELYVEWVVGYMREKNIARDFDRRAYAKYLSGLDW